MNICINRCVKLYALPLTRGIAVTLRVKSKFIFLVLLPFFTIYFLLQSVMAIDTSYNLITDLDKIIPFIPEFIWIYHTIIPVYIFTILLLIQRRPVFLTAIASTVLASVSMLTFYALFPAFYPRDGYVEASISGFLVELTRSIDGSNNTFPSSHVTFAWLLVLFMSLSEFVKKHKWVQFIYVLWACLISISTVVLKQHFILDVFSGINLAVLCYFLAKSFVFERMLLTN